MKHPKMMKICWKESTTLLWNALLVVIAMALSAAPAGAQGNIWITGHDVGVHEGQHGYDSVVFDYLRTENGTSTTFPGPGNYKISLIGSMVMDGSGTPLTAVDPTNWSAHPVNGNGGLYSDMTFYSTDDLRTGAGTQASPDLNWVITNSDCLVILSKSGAGFGGGSLDDDGSDDLNDQSAAIQSAFNAGDLDLFVLAGGNSPNYYDFLSGTGFLSGSGTLAQNSGFYITTAGCMAGLLGNGQNQGCPGTNSSNPNMVNHLTHNSFGYSHDCYDSNGDWVGGPTYNQGLLVKMETLPDTDYDNDGANGNACERVISVANTNIFLPSGCGQIIVPEILCDLDAPGNYNYSFHIGNDSGFDVVKVLIPDVDLGDGTVIDVEPNIIEMIIADQTSSLLTDLTFSGGAPGTSFDLAIGLMAKNDDGELFECCQLVETIELPHCCNSLLNATVHDTDPPPMGPPEYNQIQFDITNEEYLKPTVASHLFLVPITPGLTFDPDYFYLSPGIADNTSTNVPLVTNLGQTYGVSTPITFEVVIHNEDFSECCNEIHTLSGMASPLPVQAPFLRGDSNTDGLFDIGDAIYLLVYLFTGIGPVPCEAAADTNGDAMIDIGDTIYTLEALFAGGSDPPYPYPGCGLESEANPDHLECQSYGVCP